MPPNDSSTGGYLAPIAPVPIEDSDLEDALQAMVVGITGLDPTLVRPRWQPDPPPTPDQSVNWCAIGITESKPDDNAALIHHPDGDGYDELQRHEELSILASFYGPNASATAKRMRAGLWIEQNREAMQTAGMGLVDVSPIVYAPELLNEKWRHRVDLPITIRRIEVMTFPVLNILEGVGTITTDADHTEDFDTANKR